MTRFHFIVNPVAGRGRGETIIPSLKESLSNLGLDFTLVRTEGVWHAVDLARSAAESGADVVIAVGGDGTANEVLNGLMLYQDKSNQSPVMGILGVGRGNDFAYGMDLPLAFEQEISAIAANRSKWVDIGRVTGGNFPQGRYFGNGVGIGFDAVVGFEALKMKRLTGFISYLVAALKVVFIYYRAPKVHIETDQQSFDIFALMVSIMNGRRMGGGFQMAPLSRPDDGLLDICIAEQVSKFRTLALIPLFLKGTQFKDPAIHSLQTRKIKVTALEGSLPAHTDGETLCTAGDNLEAEIIPRAIRMIGTSKDL